MELPKAVTLLTQAIAGFHEAVGQRDKLEMAEVVDVLRRVIPNLLADGEDRNSFLNLLAWSRMMSLLLLVMSWQRLRMRRLLAPFA